MNHAKTFRLFISSTFSDFQKERQVLQTEVFPTIKEYASSMGYTFQPIDLRWGISHEAQLDQKTLELCLEEVRSCKSYPYPNFLVMLGDRYGWVPLPYAIESEEFEEVLKFVVDIDKGRLLAWYEKDLNQLPASYILKERTGLYEEYDSWAKVENELRAILQRAVASLNGISDEARKYFLSATEAEVVEGIFPYFGLTKYQRKLIDEKKLELETIDTKHIFGFFRDIVKDSKKSDRFIVDDVDYEKAQQFKSNVKEVLMNSFLVNTREGNKEDLDYFYIEQFKSEITDFLKNKIDDQKELDDRHTFTPLQLEKESQQYFATQKKKAFLETDRLDILLGQIENYIKSDVENTPLVIYGKSGSGKSALIAKAIELAEVNRSNKVLFRFVGATPSSGTSKEILMSIFDELGKDMRNEIEKGQGTNDSLMLDARDNYETFEKFSYRIYDEIMNIDEEVVIFIDAIDQLNNDDMFLWLPKKLPSNVKIIISALNDDNYHEDSKYFKILENKTVHLKGMPEYDEPLKLLKGLLEKESRTLQRDHEEYFLDQYDTSRSPLYVVIVAEEMKHWKSNDYVRDNPLGKSGKGQSLAHTQADIIKEYIKNLSEVYHHDERFVEKVLGYIYASQDGLSESELLQLLATDQEFINEIAPEVYHKNPTKELPLVHWSRLYTQLKPFVSLKSQDGEELMYFFHREFEDVVSEFPTQKIEHDAIIKATLILIERYQNKPFDENRWGKLCAIVISKYEQKYISKGIEYARLIANIDNEDWINNYIYCVENITENYDLHNKHRESIFYRDGLLQLSRLLYEKSTKWKSRLKLALQGLATSHSGNRNINEALKYNIELEKLHKDEYQNTFDTQFKYATALGDLSVSFCDKQKYEESTEKAEESYKILKQLYDNELSYKSEHKNRVIRSYTSMLSNLIMSYTKTNDYEKAIFYGELYSELYEKHFDIIKPTQYTTYLMNFADAHFSLFSTSNYKIHLEKAIALGEKSEQYIKNKFQIQPDIWIEEYVHTLTTLANYLQSNDSNKTLLLAVKCKKILEPYYKDNQNRWKDYYYFIVGILKKYNVNSVDEKEPVDVFKVIIIAQNIANSEGSTTMKRQHLIKALSFIKLNKDVEIFLSALLSDFGQKLFNHSIDNRNNLVSDISKELKKSLDLKNLIHKFEEKFKENSIGLYCYKNSN